MTIKFTNNATSTLAAGINSSVTSFSVATGQGSLFPTLSGADVFYATISNTGGSVEIVQVTARSTDAFTVVRGQDGTTAFSWNAGDKVELRATAAGLAAMAQTANLAAIAASGSASDLSSGTANTARLGSGTANSTTYLRGDQTWATITSFPAGTAMLFVQTAAPTGWTKSTTHNDKALRIVSGTAGTGGSVAFTTAFASGLSDGATTLNSTQIPSHAHTTQAGAGVQGGGPNSAPVVGSCATSPNQTQTGNTGGGGSHNHTLPSFAVSYVDVIIATKD